MFFTKTRQLEILLTVSAEDWNCGLQFLSFYYSQGYYSSGFITLWNEPIFYSSSVSAHFTTTEYVNVLFVYLFPCSDLLCPLFQRASPYRICRRVFVDFFLFFDLLCPLLQCTLPLKKVWTFVRWFVPVFWPTLFSVSAYFAASRDRNVLSVDWSEASDLPSVSAYFTATEDVNVLSVDWSLYADLLYPLARLYVVPVGKFMAKFVDWLVLEAGVSLDSMHLIGLSLGAQVAGTIGEHVTSGSIGRITGTRDEVRWERGL